jgi:tetratricopeptide (TPR) repeat protein
MSPVNTRAYFWSPAIVILVMTLAILTDIFYKSRIPHWLVLIVMCFAIIGNIVAFPKHEAIFIREGQLYSSFQSSSAILNTFKNLDTLDNVRDPLIEKNPVFQFFKSRKKNNVTGGCKILEFAKGERPCIRPDAADVYNEKGIFYAKNGQYQLAIDYFNKAIRLEPAHVHALSTRGLAYVSYGQYQLAIADFNQTISLKPDFVEAFIDRGVTYLIQRNKESGCRDAQKACSLGECKLLEMAKRKGYCY